MATARILKVFSRQNAVTLAVVLIVLMLIIPLPTFLLDFFMAVNFLLGILVLLNALSVRRPIDFSTFPNVLLMSTILGLGLNVSSTRLIFSKGEAFDGAMIKAFAGVVIGSEGSEGLLIGFVIFIILVAVQAVVIAKGAKRVSEVKARFELDGMQQQLMAVDVEFNSGQITPEEAAEKRAEIRQSSDFYSTMDGASQFVSGTIKIGILITALNLIVGIILGMVLRGEPFSRAIQTYASFTIGDGLLAQMPSLFMSVASGMLITRPARDFTLGNQLQKEFSSDGTIYVISGIAMIILGLLPHFPAYILIPMGVLLILYGSNLQKSRKKAEEVAKEGDAKKNLAASAQVTKTARVEPPDPISLEIGHGLLSLVDTEAGNAELRNRVRGVRNEIAISMGFVIPEVRIHDNIQLAPNEYCIKFKGVAIGKAQLRPGWFLCLDTGSVTKEISGEKTTDPTFGLPAMWIPNDERLQAEQAGYAVIDPPTVIATHLTELIKIHAAEILDKQAVSAILEELAKDYPIVVHDAKSAFPNLGEITQVFKGLLAEQVSIRNTISILEAITEYADIAKKLSENIVGQTNFLVNRARQALSRQLCSQYSDEDGVLHVFTLEPSFEEKLLNARVDTLSGIFVQLDMQLQSQWIAALDSAFAVAIEKGYLPVILCREDVRILVKKSTEREIPKLVVLSVSEIAGDTKIESLGVIKVG